MGLGGFAPTVGIIGTVVSLTHVLANLGKPDELGPLIASAFVATLWGLLTANFMWLPIGGKLRKLAQLESDRQTLLMEGLLAVQAGSQPRLLGERLKAMVPPAARARHGRQGGKAGKKADDGRRPAAGGLTMSANPRGRGRGRAKKGGHDDAEHPDERWMASYMDMITVLMCMFLVLFAMSTVDQEKYIALKNSLATGFGEVEVAEDRHRERHRRDEGPGRGRLRLLDGQGPGRPLDRRVGREGHQRRPGVDRRCRSTATKQDVAAAKQELDDLKAIQQAITGNLQKAGQTANVSSPSTPAG